MTPVQIYYSTNGTPVISQKIPKQRLMQELRGNSRISPSRCCGAFCGQHSRRNGVYPMERRCKRREELRRPHAIFQDWLVFPWKVPVMYQVLLRVYIWLFFQLFFFSDRLTYKRLVGFPSGKILKSRSRFTLAQCWMSRKETPKEAFVCQFIRKNNWQNSQIETFKAF